MSRSTKRLLAALIAGSVSTFALAQTSHDPASEPVTHADNKAAKEQAKANKKAAVAQAKADREKADAQSDADKAAADARVKDAKKQE
jgi:membrane protein involved in colicin uptake